MLINRLASLQALRGVMLLWVSRPLARMSLSEFFRTGQHGSKF
jgi:hypothetical protein